MGMSEIIQKMKVFLQNEIPTEEIKMTDVKTKDDIILSFEGELIAGVEIFIVDETGKTPALDGEYILEDDRIVVVKDGKVEEIKVQEPIEAPEAEVAEVVAAEDIIPVEDIKTEEPAADSNIDERVKKLEDEINQLKSILAEMTTEMSKTELKNDIKEDLKLSRIKPTEKVELKNSNSNSNVQNILKNIYNTKK